MLMTRVIVFLLCFTGACRAADLSIYADASANGFNPDCTWSDTVDFNQATIVHAGTKAIRFTPAQYEGLSWCTPSGGISTANYRALRFWVHGGTSGGQNIKLAFATGNNGTELAHATVAQLIGGPIPANAWVQVDASFDTGPLAFNGTFTQVYFQDENNAAQPNVYFDDITLLERGTGAPDLIFANGFDPNGGTPAAAIVIERDVTVDTMLSERWTWRDRANKPRAITLAHNDQNGPGTRGGEMRRYAYETPAGTRVVTPTSGGFGGFGYVVSHLEDPTPAGMLGQDDSPLGHGYPGTWSRILEGHHHAILRFTQNYPRYYCTYVNDACVAGSAVTVQMPVTIEWLVATGRDHPLWTVSYDLTGAPQDRISADSRSPYGDLNFDGNTANPDIVKGVGWGDHYKFVTTSAGPVTLNSPWTWNVPNTIPYVYLWTQTVDAEMGIVLTQNYLRQDAGGYYGTDRWNTTSAAGNACTNPATLMPCDYNWPYQSINYSFGGPNVATDSKRLAWGTNFGFLGQTSYPEHGYGANRSGWPRQSYSTYIVLDRHSQTPTATTVTGVEAAMAATLTASVGTVRTSGPAGVNRPDTLPYQPAGYNRVYGTWEVDAAANAATLNFTANGLDRPIFVLNGYTGALPSVVRIDGVALTADADYFATLDAARQKLWLTVNRTWSGSHGLVVVP